MATYDIQTKFLPHGHKVFVLHPGFRKRQFDVFKTRSSVFLEIPGFVPSESTFQSDSEIARRIRLSREVEKYIFSDEDGVENPVRDPNRYSGSPSDSISSAMHNVITLFRDARPGDLVLCPGSGPFSPVLCGELVKEVDHDDVMPVEYFSSELLPFRPVNWVNRNIRRVDFGHLFAKRLANRRAIIEISDNFLKSEIYKRVYSNYVTTDNAKITIYGSQYDSKDPSGVVDAINIVRYLAAGFVAREQGRLNEFASLEMDEAIEMFVTQDHVLDFAIQFTSPGKITLITFAYLMAISVGIGVGVLTDSNITFDEIRRGVSIINSNSTNDQVRSLELGNSIAEIVDAIGPSKTERLQRRAQKSKQKIGFRSDVVRRD